MADQYTMNWTDGTYFIVQPKTVDYTSSSIPIYGKGSQSYGEGMQENLLHIIEHFGNVTPPAMPRPGQVWYNTAAQLLNLWDGSTWVTQHDPAFVALVTAHMSDTVIHLTQAEQDMLTGLLAAVPNPSYLMYLSGLTGNVQIQLDTNVSNINTKVNKAGDTMTGDLSMSNNFIHNLINPSAPGDAVNKGYMDSSVSNAVKSLSCSAPGTALYQYRYEVYSTAGQTAFSLPWTYVPGNNSLAVFVNGVKQLPTSYTETNSSTVTMSSGLTAGDEVMFAEFIFGGGLNGSSLNGISVVNVSSQVAPGGTAVFTVPSYTVGFNTLFIWVNGIKQIAGASQSYVETNATTITFNQNLSAGDVVEAAVLVLMNPSTGSGQTWPAYSQVYEETFIASTAGQTLFTLTTPYYHTTTVGDKGNAVIDVFVQGVFQGSDEISETNGSSFILATGVSIGTIVEFYAYKLS